MKHQWIRLYRESLHNPKIVSLNDRQHRTWHNLLLIAGDDGRLPAIRDIACHLRMTPQEAETVVCELVDFGLVDADCLVQNNLKFRMHDWTTHQYVSDSSTERVQKFRNKNKCNGNETFQKRHRAVTVTPPESDTDTEEDSASSSSFEKPRGKKHDFNSDFEKKTKTEEPEKLKRVAEGLGLDVQSIVDRVNARQPTNRGAYFTKLAVNDFREKHPKAPEKAIRAALWGNDAALGQLLAMAVGVEP